MPLRDWIEIMTMPATRSRLEPDTLERQQDYGRQVLENLAAKGRTGVRWRPR